RVQLEDGPGDVDVVPVRARGADVSRHELLVGNNGWAVVLLDHVLPAERRDVVVEAAASARRRKGDEDCATEAREPVEDAVGIEGTALQVDGHGRVAAAVIGEPVPGITLEGVGGGIACGGRLLTRIVD